MRERANEGEGVPKGPVIEKTAFSSPEQAPAYEGECCDRSNTRLFHDDDELS
ncbi:hypothetical protein Bpfe_025159, partial [Biomphalaria pfeifferi]